MIGITRRKIFVSIIPSVLITAGCLDLGSDPTEHDAQLFNRDDSERDISLTIVDENGETLFEVSENLSPNTISEGHTFEGTPDHARGTGNGEEDEVYVSWDEPECDPESKIRIDAGFGVDGDFIVDYLC